MKVIPVTRAQPSAAKAIEQRDYLRALFPHANYQVRDHWKGDRALPDRQSFYVVAVIEYRPDYGEPPEHPNCRLFTDYGFEPTKGDIDDQA